VAAGSEGKRTLVDAWQDVQKRLAEQQPSQRQGTTRKFAEYAWDKFDAREVASILALPGDSYFAHKDVLYEGFCAWVACPNNVTLPRHGMVLRAALHLDAAEQFGRDRFDGIGQIGDIYIRTNIVGPEFFEEIYYPIGGILRIARSLSRAGYRAKLANESKSVRHAVRVVEIYHHHVEHLLPQKTFGKPSLNTAAGLVSELDPAGDKLPGERAMKDYWSASKQSVALAYSAQSIIVKENLSLLDLIIQGKTTWRAHRQFVPAWFGRARYVAEHVLCRCAETETGASTLRLLPDIPADKFNPPFFTEQQTSNIAKKFERNTIVNRPK
jgi:hypothetical protein